MAMATASNCIKIYICERAELLLSLDRPTGRMAVASASCPFPAPGPIQAAGLQPVILPCHDCDKWRKMMPATTGTTALSVFVLLPGSSAYIPAGPLSCFPSPFPSSARLWYIFYVCKHTHTHTHRRLCNFGTYKMQPAICRHHPAHSLPSGDAAKNCTSLACLP